MATVMVENQLGSIVKRFRLPADDKTASSFCSQALEGIYRIYAKSGEQGDLNVTEAILVRVLLRDRDTGKHFYLQFYAKPTVGKADIQKALSDWTGIDEIFILDFRHMKFTAEGE